jgi:hypothetical protein
LLKNSPAQIALIKHGIYKVTFRKNYLVKPRLGKGGSSEFPAKEGGVAEITLLKPKGDPKLAALLKIDTKHFAVTERNISKCSVCNRCHTKVTGDELALLKSNF